MQALPSSPILVWGLSDVPSIGDQFEAFKNEKQAKSALQERKDKASNNIRNHSTSDKHSLL